MTEYRSVFAWEKWGEGGKEQKQEAAEGQEKTFGGDGYVYYFDCDDGWIYTCQNSSNHTIIFKIEV